ncbi:MAG: dihydroorotase [Burkholderiales bacterium]|nr:dihydroorotase [Rhodocyclaceae bacterium]MCA3023927.1 dihydroorotase [Rhodocyclaceae bacterium]MCA3030713.1 dihydroorotase [Rhodocyclaceae bacterium]MCA3036143.1 dihydroorotase [Rhodocyclaceae bacterium]MCA3046588.1 dihydroorotase [Rhodocyclaceae bacterium]
MKLEIRNGRLIDPSIGINARDEHVNLYIEDAIVSSVGNEAPSGFVADKVIDAAGKVVAPGLVDLCARLREPGYEHKATLESELMAASAGGVTSLVCPPDTEPVLDEPGLVEMLKRRGWTLNQARIYPLGALTAGLKGEKLAEMLELAEAGCIGFFQADRPIVDTSVLYRAMQYAATYGFTIWLRPEDAFLARGGIAHDGEVASRLGLAGIPSSAETVAIATITTLMRETGARVHLARLSSAAGVELVRRAKGEGLPLTADVGIHHLLLTDRDIGYFDSQYRFSPPLRSPSDRDALSAGVIDGTINAICSDHTPTDEDEKNVPFGEATPGASGLEMLLPLTLKWAAHANVPVATALARITVNAAEVLGKSQGRFVAGAPADVCIFDPRAFWAVTRETLVSQGKNTPYLAREMQGKVTHTICAGRIVYTA